MGFIAELFGYLLNALYTAFNNYGIAIIVFSVILRIILIPITIKQQKSMKKSAELQAEMKEISKKYKNNPEKLNQETIDLYKREKMSPFSGCLSSIVQLVIILSVFWLVSQPLTYMKRVDKDLINQYKQEIQTENSGKTSSYSEIEVINKKGSEDDRVYINMEFLGLDLSKVPGNSLNDWKVYVIPALYVISSIISIRMTTRMTEKKKESNVTNAEDTQPDELEAMQAMNKNMTYMMPIMSVFIAFIAPLGLALYWFVSNLLMIIEKLIIDNIMEHKEEKKMPKSIVAEGKTTNEAISNGLKELNVSKDKVDIKILETGEKRSFFSILAPRVVKVELTLKEKEQKHNEKTVRSIENGTNNIEKEKHIKREIKEEDIEIAKTNIENFLKDFSRNFEDIKYTVKYEDEFLNIEIQGNSSARLIGYRGDVLNSLQTILNSIASKHCESRIRVVLNIGDYKAKREKSLEELAEKISKTVLKTGKSVTLEPMVAYERKIIHNHLQSNNRIKTYSIGDEPYRKVVISKK